MSHKLRTMIEQVRRDPSRFREITEQLRREDLELNAELVQWVEGQEKGPSGGRESTVRRNIPPTKEEPLMGHVLSQPATWTCDWAATEEYKAGSRDPCRLWLQCRRLLQDMMG